MINNILRLIQSLLIGFILSRIGYSFKTVVFWIVMIIMALQWIKEQEK